MAVVLLSVGSVPVAVSALKSMIVPSASFSLNFTRSEVTVMTCRTSQLSLPPLRSSVSLRRSNASCNTRANALSTPLSSRNAFSSSGPFLSSITFSIRLTCAASRIRSVRLDSTFGGTFTQDGSCSSEGGLPSSKTCVPPLTANR